MRKLLFMLAALAAVGLVIPSTTTPAEAKKGHHSFKIKKFKSHHNRGNHYGWYKRTNHPHYYRR